MFSGKYYVTGKNCGVSKEYLTTNKLESLDSECTFFMQEEDWDTSIDEGTAGESE